MRTSIINEITLDLGALVAVALIAASIVCAHAWVKILLGWA